MLKPAAVFLFQRLPQRGMRQSFTGALCLLAALVLATAPALAQRAPLEAEHGIVASASRLASEIGVDVMRRGGNAADAMVATGVALAVTYPRAGNLGGGGFALIPQADGRTTSIDFREMAPAGASRDMYLDAQGKIVPNRSTVGHLASGVPGTVAGLAMLHARYGSGKLSWSQLLEPARQLAAKGFPVTAALARDLRASDDLMGQFADSRRVFLRDGRFYAAGETFRQPDLAQTLQRLQKHGPTEFYTGRTAQLIAAEMAAHGGLMTQADLASYHAIERVPLRGSYRGHEIITMGPPSSGGIALLQMLGMLETRDVAALGYHSAAQVHLFTEVMRRAFRDRAAFLGDADFHPVPVAQLLDKRYVTSLLDDFNPQRATSNDALRPSSVPQPESTQTTHFSAVDAAGNMIGITYTLNGLFGSGVTATGTGVLLNNEMDDFTSKVGEANMFGLLQAAANSIAPGKRPLSAMTPTLVLKDGKPFLVTGSPGGPTIINTVLQVITNVVDFSFSVTRAVDAPRFHHQWQPDSIRYEPFFTSPDSVALLQAMGHRLASSKLYANAPEADGRSMGDAESIMIDPQTGRRLGASDPRSPDSAAVGY
ncbi:MAG: gamma-glutamyltransferase [Steroidobacteraceae bacterium]